MSTSILFVLLASFSILLTGAWAWRQSGNYMLLANTTIASFGLLFAAHQLSLRSPGAIFVSLLCTMLLGGRFLGTWWRSRRENGLPVQLVGVTAALSLAATLTAYCTLFRGA